MRFGIILSAGNQSRFKSPLPKALVKINGKVLLEENIQRMSKYCDEVFVICSFQNEQFFKKYNHIAINSGKGSGDAVLKALIEINKKHKFSKDDTCFIIWGDCLIEDQIYKQVLDNYNNTGLIPCVFEENPYVQLKETKNNKVIASFSKFNEAITAGFHDLSLFYFNCQNLLNYLLIFQKKIINKEDNYIHKHGNEMEFLDVFNETEIEAKILEIKDYKDFSFNTVEELENID